MVGKLAGKVALVTGSSRGIGLSIAKKFDDAGAKVILHSRNGIDQNIIQTFKQQPIILKFDINSSQSIEKAILTLYNDVEFPGIDILVNNAGITRDRLAINMSSDDFSTVIDTNLNGTFNVTQPIFKKMIKSRKGTIINMSSIVGLSGNIGQVNYAASKAGLVGMTKALAREGALRNICVNAIAPGMFDSDMTKDLSDKIKDAILSTIPLKRFGKVDEIADVALFLASSQYITGQTIVIDGGQSI